MNKNNKLSVDNTLRVAADIIVAIVKGLVWLSRNVWKRYLGIETPLYKWWWKDHSKYMQHKLNQLNNYRAMGFNEFPANF